jgi:hypothetical protein
MTGCLHSSAVRLFSYGLVYVAVLEGGATGRGGTKSSGKRRPCRLVCPALAALEEFDQRLHGQFVGRGVGD